MDKAKSEEIRAKRVHGTHPHHHRKRWSPAPAKARADKKSTQLSLSAFWLNRQLPILPDRFQSSTFGV